MIKIIGAIVLATVVISITIGVIRFEVSVDNEPKPLIANPLLNTSSEFFYDIVKPMMSDRQFSSCSNLWRKGDVGGVDCYASAGKIASVFSVKPAHATDARVWNRYYETEVDIELRRARADLLGK